MKSVRNKRKQAILEDQLDSKLNFQEFQDQQNIVNSLEATFEIQSFSISSSALKKNFIGDCRLGDRTRGSADFKGLPKNFFVTNFL